MDKSIFVIAAVLILLVIYFIASRKLRAGGLTKEEERKWKFVRITSTGITLFICATMITDYMG